MSYLIPIPNGQLEFSCFAYGLRAKLYIGYVLSGNPKREF